MIKYVAKSPIWENMFVKLDSEIPEVEVVSVGIHMNS